MDSVCLGWCPDVPDLRDELIIDCGETVLPSRIDLRDNDLGLVTQRRDAAFQMSSAFSTLRMIDWQFRKWRGQRVDANADFIHQLAVRIAGGSSIQSGAGGNAIGLRAILKTLKRFGAPPQYLCQSETAEQMLARPELYAYADVFQDLRYLRLDSPWHGSRNRLNAMRRWLTLGNPFLLGFAVPHNLSLNSTVIPLDDYRGGTLGGTACVVMGFDDEVQLFGQVNVRHSERIEHLQTGAFLIEISLAARWNQYMWLPYAFVEAQFARDAWAVKFDSHSIDFSH